MTTSAFRFSSSTAGSALSPSARSRRSSFVRTTSPDREFGARRRFNIEPLIGAADVALRSPSSGQFASVLREAVWVEVDGRWMRARVERIEFAVLHLEAGQAQDCFAIRGSRASEQTNN